MLDAAARDAAAAALAAACEHNLRGAIEAEDVASECDMRGALGRLHAYRRMDEDAAKEFKAEATTRAGEAAKDPTAPAADPGKRARSFVNLADTRRQAAAFNGAARERQASSSCSPGPQGLRTQPPPPAALWRELPRSIQSSPQPDKTPAPRPRDP